MLTGTAGIYCKLYRCSIWNSNYWAGGTVNVTVTAVTDTTLNLTNVSNGTCSRPLTATATVTVNALPVAATLSSNSPICSGADAILL
jgi:hypothetical protein